jgi:CheY-like chemotaxis protein
MISAQDWNTIEKDAREAGIKKFIQKPLFASTIADAINECLGIEDTIPAELRAEDIEINREILLTLPEPLNPEIVCAENGKIALEKDGPGVSPGNTHNCADGQCV